MNSPFQISPILAVAIALAVQTAYGQNVTDAAPAPPSAEAPTLDPNFPPANAELTDWMRARLKRVAPELQDKYRHHNGEWWFQTNDGGWRYHRHGQWQTYNASTFRPLSPAPSGAVVIEQSIIHDGYRQPRVLGYRGSHVPAQTTGDYQRYYGNQPDSRGTFYRSDINLNGFYGFPARSGPWYPRYGF